MANLPNPFNEMKQVTLYFPDSSSLTEFLLVQRLSKVETSGFSLAGPLSDQQILIACTQYGAMLQTITNTAF